MAPQLEFHYLAQRVKAPAPSPPSVQVALKLAAEKLKIPEGSYDLWDRYGKIEFPEDLQRAMHMAGAGDCVVLVKEHEHFIQLRLHEEKHKSTENRVSTLEAHLKNANTRFDDLVGAAREEIMNAVKRLEGRVDNEIKPVIDALIRDKNRLQKDVRNIEEIVGQLDLQEMKQIASDSAKLGNEVRDAVRKVNDMQSAWITDKAKLTEMCMQSQQDLHELQRYLQGKVDVCIEADGDLRREQQLCVERMQMVADDVRILGDEHHRLMRQCTGALEESEELRTLLGQVREDNEHLKSDHGNVKTRVHCLEGTALDVWEGFMPGVLYFQRFHRIAKGDDVQFSPDFQLATGRGFLAATGLVIGNNEGLAVADGPCRRFGTPGSNVCYFELEVEEVKSVPAGMGGLWVGVSLQSAQEIIKHPAKEFDGWLVGGNSKAMVCRSGTPADLPIDPDKVPETFAPGASDGTGITENIHEAIALLRTALPPRLKGEMREFGSQWSSQHLKKGDRIGVLWRCNRDAGARMRVSVNGDIVVTQQFSDAPTAQAVGFFTPVVRLAGSGKSVRILPGLTPPSRMLAD
mmetsp:Transcript_51288/g.130398  ORF Transcript_51288/g.130398 Transcript_51288/m.130398 type:complete len:574 (+) Transcript_51288:89-1810(+)